MSAEIKDISLLEAELDFTFAAKLIAAMMGEAKRLSRDESATLERIAYSLLVDEVSRFERTGTLRRSILTEPTRDGFSIQIGGPQAPYARAVHTGTRGHWIAPRKKKALYNPDYPHPVKKKIWHPGAKPNPYWARFFRRLYAELERRIPFIAYRVLFPGM